MIAGSIGIIGAGAVGAAIAFAAMLRGTARRIVLVDKQEEKARGEALDLAHGGAFVPPIDIVSGPLSAIAGCDVVVITAGAKQKPGQSRLELAATNVEIFRDLVPQVVALCPHSWLLVVSNPVDVLTYAALKFSEMPPRRVVGSGTVLDSARFRHLIGRRIQISPANIHAYIIGEHGDSEVPVWSSASVGNVPLGEFDPVRSRLLSASDRDEIYHGVRDAAQQIIASKGATCWAIGLSTVRILEAYFRDENAVLSVSRLVNDYYGVRDVCMSAPSIVSRQGAGPALDISLSEGEIERFRASAAAIRATLNVCGL